jgi:serine/threonine protein kinase
MSYCDGGSLDNLINKILLPEPVIAHVFLRVAAALLYLERSCLVHRDLVRAKEKRVFFWLLSFFLRVKKPGNILLSRNGEIRLGDLGLMRPQFECAFGGSKAGTPGFRAPEVLLGDGATTKSDVYSFGCSLFATIYGDAPFAQEHASTLLWKTCTNEGVPKWTGEKVSFVMLFLPFSC